jgi:hypothetical protein
VAAARSVPGHSGWHLPFAWDIGLLPGANAEMLEQPLSYLPTASPGSKWIRDVHDVPPFKDKPSDILPGQRWSKVFGLHSKVQIPDFDIDALFSSTRKAKPRDFRDPPPDSKENLPTEILEEGIACGFWQKSPLQEATCNVYVMWNGKKWIIIANCRKANKILSQDRAPHKVTMWTPFTLNRVNPIDTPSEFSCYGCTRDIASCYNSCLLPECLKGKFVFQFGDEFYEYLVCPFGFCAAPYMLDNFLVSPCKPNPSDFPGIQHDQLLDDAQVHSHGLPRQQAILTVEDYLNHFMGNLLALPPEGFEFSVAKNSGSPGIVWEFAGMTLKGTEGILTSAPSISAVSKTYKLLLTLVSILAYPCLLNS